MVNDVFMELQDNNGQYCEEKNQTFHVMLRDLSSCFFLKNTYVSLKP
jgi:hypothetical protein